MRHILVDQARRKLADKRGNKPQRVELGDTGTSHDNAVEMLSLDHALTALEHNHPQLFELVELRFFAGLSVADTARALGVSERSVVRNWRAARAMIHHALA